MSVGHAFSNTVGNWTGTVTVGNSAGQTTTMAATDIVRPQDWNSAHNIFVTFSGNTFGSSTFSGTNIVTEFDGGIYVSALDASKVEIFHPPISAWPMKGEDLEDVTPNSGTTGATGGSTQSTWSLVVQPWGLPHELYFDRIRMPFLQSGTSGGTGSATVMFALGLYTLTGDSLSLLTDWYFNVIRSQNSSTAVSWTAWWGTNSTSNTTTRTGNVQSNIPVRCVGIMHEGKYTLTAGEYFVAAAEVCRTSGASNILGAEAMRYWVGAQGGEISFAEFWSTGNTVPYRFLQGGFTTSTNVAAGTRMTMPGSIATSLLTVGARGQAEQMLPGFFMFKTGTAS